MDIRPTAMPLHSDAARSTSPDKITEAARQLESQFARMMIKSMRDASFGDSLFPGENQLFRDMYDERLAQTMSQGRGLGLQSLIARQLGGGQDSSDSGEAAPAQAGQLATLSRNNALRAYQAQLPATAAPAGAAVTAQAAMLAPLHAAVDAIAGRETASFHQGLRDDASAASPLDLLGAAGNDWSKMDDRWRPTGAQADQSLAARHAAAQLGTGTPEAFVASIWPHAQRAANELGVDPRALVAQAALETAWGKRLPSHGDGRSANNLFGIKATGWKGAAVNNGTHEYVDGVRRNENASFRAYASIGDSFSDYVALLKRSPRYQGALAAGTDVAGFARGLQQGGYATDPTYANKIAAIADGATVQRALAAIDQAHVRMNPATTLAMNR
jgi:flagellar protein FlgJ